MLNSEILQPSVSASTLSIQHAVRNHQMGLIKHRESLCTQLLCIGRQSLVSTGIRKLVRKTELDDCESHLVQFFPNVESWLQMGIALIIVNIRETELIEKITLIRKVFEKSLFKMFFEYIN